MPEVSKNSYVKLKSERDMKTWIKNYFVLSTLMFSLCGTVQAAEPVCSYNNAPYRDLDFLVGSWEFFTMDGKKIADQKYFKKESGCLILEDWKTN
jgi:hypothetical protein